MYLNGEEMLFVDFVKKLATFLSPEVQIEVTKTSNHDEIVTISNYGKVVKLSYYQTPYYDSDEVRFTWEEVKEEPLPNDSNAVTRNTLGGEWCYECDNKITDDFHIQHRNSLHNYHEKCWNVKYSEG